MRRRSGEFSDSGAAFTFIVPSGSRAVPRPADLSHLALAAVAVCAVLASSPLAPTRAQGAAPAGAAREHRYDAVVYVQGADGREGTGVVVAASGYVLTSAFIVEGADAVSVSERT